MPPKDAKKPKKQSAAEKAREIEEQRKREEDARLAREAEVRRLREQFELKERQDIAKLFAAEQASYDAEEEEIKRIKATKAAELASAENRAQAKAEWQLFQDCVRLPNPRSDRELNTYVSLYDDEPAVTPDRATLHAVTNRLPEVEDLCAALESHVARALDAGDEQEAGRLVGHLVAIRKAANRKWELMAAHVLQHMDLFAPGQEQNENFHITNTTKGYRFALWSNLTRNPRHKTLDFSELSIAATLPKPVILSNVAIRFLHETSGTVAPSYDLRQGTGKAYSVVGGVLSLDLVELPELPKVVNNWTIRPILSSDGTLRRMEYPFKRIVTEEPDEQESAEEEVSAGQWGIHVSFRIPAASFVQPERAKVMWWNEAEQGWQADGIDEVEIEPEHGVVKFKTTHFAPTAVVQDSFLEYPLEHWQLSPSPTPNRALLLVKGRFNEIEIEVGEGECRLIKPKVLRGGRPELSGLDNEAWFPPRILLHKMSRLGLNYLGPRTMKGIDLDTLRMKNPLGDDILSFGISLCCPAYEFRRSPAQASGGNGLCANRVAIQFRQLDGQGLPIKVDVPPPADMPDFQAVFSSSAQPGPDGSRKSTPALSKSTASIAKGKSKGDVTKDGKTKSRASSPDREGSAKSTGLSSETKPDTVGLSGGDAQLPELPKPVDVPWNHIVVDTSYKLGDAPEQTLVFASPKAVIEDDTKFAILEGVVHRSVYHALKGATTDDNHTKIDRSSPLFTRTVNQLMNALKLHSYS